MKLEAVGQKDADGDEKQLIKFAWPYCSCYPTTNLQLDFHRFQVSCARLLT